MPTYQVLGLNQLERWETIEAPGDLAAIGAAPPCEEGGNIVAGGPETGPDQLYAARRAR